MWSRLPWDRINGFILGTAIATVAVPPETGNTGLKIKEGSQTCCIVKKKKNINSEKVGPNGWSTKEKRNLLTFLKTGFLKNKSVI